MTSSRRAHRRASTARSHRARRDPSRYRTALPALSVRARLTLLTALFAVLVVLGGLIAAVGLRDSLARTDRQTTVVGPALDANRDVEDTMITAQSALRGYLVANLSLRSGVASGGLNVAEFRRQYGDAQARYKSELQRVDSLLSRAEYTSDPQVRRDLEGLRRRQNDAVAAWWEYAQLAQSRFDLDPAFVASGDALFEQVEAANAAVSDRIVVEREALRREMSETIRETQRQVLVATLIALIAATGFGWWTIHGLTGPLARLRNTCREQADGSRTAWAAEDRGAREVRELARGLNALTATQHALLDEQAYALALAKTTRELARRIQDAGDVEAAFVLAVEGVGISLAADRGSCMVSRVGGVDTGLCATWTRRQGVAQSRVPAAALRAVQDDVRRLWRGDRCLLVEAGAGDDGVLPLPRDCAGGVEAAIVAAFGTGDTPYGVLVIGTHHAQCWTPAQAGFVQGIAAELGRAVAAAEVARARSEHVHRLEELDRQKDGFLSTVSHELRTPLTSINGYLELLEDGDAGSLSEEQARMLAVIERNAVRLRGLIEDLLLINRMRDGGAENAEAVDVDRLVTDAAEEMAPLAKAKGVLLDVASMTGVPVNGNRAQLARVLTNLLSNSVKFTPAGGRVRLRTLRAIDGGTVRIVCSDEGMGIPAAEQEKLFTRFFRASNATRAEVPGTGLGLVVVKGIVEAHGGRLQLSSTEGVGTTVVVELPISVAAAERA
ncbi:MAG: ATP-binding protein [Austwickia sp.]|nr:hypothetical protein [Austwickia sp.]MCO5310567.1 ATP-binding protein [Austwickia sp.]